jgi:hypothetical protein
MRTYNNVIAAEYDVTNRSGGEIVLKGIPVFTIIQGNKHAAVGSRIEKALPLGILFDYV